MKESAFNFIDFTYVQPCIPPWLLEKYLGGKNCEEKNWETMIWERVSPFLSQKSFRKIKKGELKTTKYTGRVLIFCNTSDSGTFRIYKDDESLEIEPRYGDVLEVESGKTKIDFSNMTGDVPVLMFVQKEKMQKKFEFEYCRDDFNLDRLRDDISSTRTTRNPITRRRNIKMDKRWYEDREAIYEDYLRRKKNEERFRINYSEEA